MSRPNGQESAVLRSAKSKRWHASVLPCDEAAMLLNPGRPEISFYQETGM